MKTIELKGVSRDLIGKKSSKAERLANNVPCVVYGGEEKNINFSVLENDFNKLIYTHEVYIVNLNIDGKDSQAIIKDVQFHPVTDRVLHIDFQRVFDNKEIIMDIPVITEGLAAGIRSGGALSLLKRKIRIVGLPGNLPDTININIEKLEIGDCIKIGDLDIKDLKFKDNDTVLILSVIATRTSALKTDSTDETEA